MYDQNFHSIGTGSASWLCITVFSALALRIASVHLCTVRPTLSGLPLSGSLYYMDVILRWIFFNPMITIGKIMWFQTQSKFCLNWKWFSYHSNINNKHSRQISLAVTCNQTSNKQNIHRSTWAESFYEITARQKRSLIVIELNAWVDWTQVCTQTVACDHAASCT